MPKIRMRLSVSDIDRAIAQIEAYQKKVRNAADTIARNLATIGFDVAYEIMDGHIYSGETISSLEVVQEEPGKYVLRAGSKALLFFEFGADVRYGSGHPWDAELGMGPGTYPDGKGHWNDPNGWWFPTDDPELIMRTDKDGQGWCHTYGNPPHMPFYLADQTIKESILATAKEALR